MQRFIRILKQIFFIPPLPTLLAAVFGYAFVLAVMILQIDLPAVQCLSYVCSAYALIVTITGFPHFTAFMKSLKKRIMEHPLMKKLQSTRIGGRFFNDIRFRTEISLYQGLFINFLYIAVKLFSGIYYRSFWFVSLAIYYILLAVMRYLLLRRGKRNTGRTPMAEELHRYRSCGIMLLIMNEALACIVVFMVHQNHGFAYPGLLIYAMALYAFYSIITAVVNLVKFKKHGSPVLSAAKVINLVAAMVSVLSLETAMLARFGEDDEAFRAIMTGATGGGICIIVIGIAVFMIWKSAIQLKQTTD